MGSFHKEGQCTGGLGFLVVTLLLPCFSIFGCFPVGGVCTGFICIGVVCRVYGVVVLLRYDGGWGRALADWFGR